MTSHAQPSAEPAVPPVRIAVVGLGYWGPNLVRNLHELSEAEVLYACDAREHTLATITRRYPGIPTETSYERVLADPEVEAVVLATPVSTHAELAAAALDAGKHVFVEKPLADSYEAALGLVERGRESGLVVMPGHTFLYSPPVVRSRELIASGELGKIYFISTSRVNLGLHQRDVSVVWDLAPHDFSILRYWLDELPARVSATSRCCLVEGTADVAFINLEFPSGTVASVEIAWLAPSKLRRTAVVGSEKMLVYEDGSGEPVRVFDSGAQVRDPATFGEYQLTYRSGDIVSLHVESREPLALELADFCNSIRQETEPRSSPQIGLDVVSMTEAVDRSLALDGQPVELDRNVIATTR